MATITTWFTLGLLGELLGTAVLAYGYTLVPEETRKRYLLLIAIPGIAIVAYALMALGFGSIQSEGHAVYVVRYVDWLLTTPLNVWFLALLAGASREDTVKLVVLQALTIVFGFAGAVTRRQLATRCSQSVERCSAASSISSTGTSQWLRSRPCPT